MAAFDPVELTNGQKTVVARTPGQLTQYIWDGYVPVGGGQVVINPPFEAFVSRAGATAGQALVLQNDGSLRFGSVASGGGGGGGDLENTLIGIDTDGTPYFDPSGVGTPVSVGVDTDGVLYFAA